MAPRDLFITWFQDSHPGKARELETILQYGDELLRANEKLALISAGDQSRFWSRHVEECIPPALVRDLERQPDLLDVGSGNGLPGVLLAILIPELKVTLLESSRKKGGFLARVCLLLGLNNTQVEVKTLEEMGAEGSWAFSRVVSRALRWTPPLIEALEAVTVHDALLYRYGPERGVPTDLSLGERVIQRLPRAGWSKDLL